MHAKTKFGTEQNGQSMIGFMIILHFNFKMPNVYSTHIYVDDGIKFQFALYPCKVESPPPLNQ